ncbi:MAG TPA: tetratricopeptide repeat protein, partial [Hyphomicrobiaceae bacterium]|nr:tetratricopeptide repeat protein [Hyphomicrobiaceae bacterium]
MRIGVAAFTGALLIAVSLPAYADNWSECASEDAETSIRACTRIIAVRNQVKDKTRLALAYYHRGTSYYRRNDCTAGIADLSESLRLNASDHRAFNNRGSCYLKTNDPTRARGDFDEALRLDPTYVLGYLNRGIASEQLGDFTRARADFTSGLAIPARRDIDTNAHAEIRRRLAALGAPGTGPATKPASPPPTAAATPPPTGTSGVAS